jgi:hypothetical protein
VTETRPLSNRIKRAIFFSAPLTWIGVLFALFGTVMLVLFASASDFKSPFVFSNADPRVEGQLIARNPTRASSNKRRIYEYVYQYQVDSGKYEGRSFDTDIGVAEGNAVTVQYVARDPATSRLEGMGLAPFGMEVALMVAIFPGIGLLMLYFALRRYRRYSYLVQHGVLTTGKVVRKEPTSTRINGHTVYSVFYRYKSRDGVLREARISTHETDKLGDEEQEPLVYDPDRPDEAVLLDAMPSTIRQLLTER